MNWKLPNQLTMGRVVLAVVFFVLLGLYKPDAAAGPWVLTAAFVIYVVAGITDVLDGYFARKWNITTAFGRIVDPFVDKVLVVGAFTMLTGANFILEPGRTGAFESSVPHWINGGMASGVQAWMVVAILAREFIVSALRGYSESLGRQFPATQAGKIKMLVQSVTICTILFQLAHVPQAPWAVGLKLALAWLTVFVTVGSGVFYVRRGVALMLSEPPAPAAGEPAPASPATPAAAPPVEGEPPPA
jgi:CDP-diacylglycerol--glycerol-3-phosphate 3-phosphatidyltransferase